MGMVYVPSFDIDDDQIEGIALGFQDALGRARGREIAQGVTLVGPHRDDLRFLVNGVDMGIYGSRGQMRTIALSLRLAEARFMRERMGDYPILLLDDVLSELDIDRRRHLLGFISPYQQVLITTTDLDRFEPGFLAQAMRLRVREGMVEGS